MKEKNIDLANYYARMACSKWNQGPWFLGWYYCIQRHRFLKRVQGMIIPESKKNNTYPWPYQDAEFANWEEDNTPGKSSIIYDPSGFAIRTAQSYCAWKLTEITGRWPTIKHEAKMKDWRQFLEEVGHAEIVAHPMVGGKYIGINPKTGLVVWYEGDSKDVGYVIVSSYVDRRYFFDSVNFVDYNWVKIT